MASDDITSLKSKSAFIRSCPDQILMSDRVLENLLHSENIYFNPKRKTRVDGESRKLVTEWMMELCQAELQRRSLKVFEKRSLKSLL